MDVAKTLLITRLLDQGKLDWDDAVGQHLPDWPQAAVCDHVTVAQPLAHTSGLGNDRGKPHGQRREPLDTVRERALARR